MRKRIGLLAILTLGAATLYGQASRTWVSGVGDDANPCSRTAPCKTFAGAISKTAAGGEIDALDPAGFGAVTITKSITLDGGGGQVASVLVTGTNAIVVSAGASDVVTIRNLRLNGLLNSGNAGLNGIRFLAGKDLNVENCWVFGFSQNGIDIALNQATQAAAHILNTQISNLNGTGIRATNAQTPVVQVGVDHAQITLVGGNGIEAAQHSRISADNSFLQHATGSGGLADDAVTADAKLFIYNSHIGFNGNGVTSGPGNTNGVGMVVGFSSIENNAGFAFNAAGGGIFSYGNSNRVSNNGSGNGTFTSIPLLP